MAQKTYGIDFGTGTIKIYKKGNGIVILERNVVSIVGKENKPIAIICVQEDSLYVGKTYTAVMAINSTTA